MSQPKSGIYMGDVVHKRLRPITHAFKYSVFWLFVDVAELTGIEKKTKLFSYNRFNLFSLYDRDHGSGEALMDHLQSIADQADIEDPVDKFFILCFPRILGYVFNPLTVYFGLNRSGQVRLLIYEVNNTFGGRQTYVLPATPNEKREMSQSCEKLLNVSPFNSGSGTYGFAVTHPDENLTIGVKLRDEAGPLIITHFRAEWQNLSDVVLLKMIARTGWMTVKVTAAIYFEAARLWFKGLRLVDRPKTKPHTITHISPPIEK